MAGRATILLDLRVAISCEYSTRRMRLVGNSVVRVQSRAMRSISGGRICQWVGIVPVKDMEVMNYKYAGP